MKKIAFLLIFLLALALTPLRALTLSGNTGFAIPVGTWAHHHSPSPYLSLGLDLFQKDYVSIGIALEMASFRGKLNTDYHLQVISPGTAVKLYPLFFLKNRSIFLRETLTYSFMQRNLHEATEKGRDFGILSALGFEYSIADRWKVIPYFGEKHYFGGIDMFIFGLEIGFKK
jgi:hypothetical protein